MRLVITDTAPINYLVMIGVVDFLPILFERIILPVAVEIELAAAGAPSSVRSWIAHPPAWLEIHETQSLDYSSVKGLEEGETAAIVLAASLDADLLLMDERKGTLVALQKGLRVTGTLGVLDMAAERGFVNFALAIERLRRTNFRMPKAVLNTLLDKHTRMDS